MNIKATIDVTQAATRPSSETEASLKLHETIYSRSDPRGEILFACPTFTRVYEVIWDELEGASHQILRHPDMPRGVFWLFWNRLQQGLPVGMFLRNKGKTDLEDWVFVLAHPCEGGYMSVGLKPTTELLGQVQAIYDALATKERNEGRSPEESAKAFLESLKSLGFPDYDRFMAHALSGEMTARDTQLGQSGAAQRSEIEQIVVLADECEELLGKMSIGFQNIRAEPVNMRILSNRLEGGGGPISSIAQNYEVMAKEMGDDLHQLDHGEIGVFDAIRRASVRSQFAILAAELAGEAGRQLIDALKAKQVDRETATIEIEALERHAAKLREEAKVESRIILDRSTKLIDSCRSLRRRINGLDVVKLMCRVESGRLENFDASLLGIIDRLDRFHGEIGSSLAEVARHSQRIHRSSRNYL